VTRPAWPKVEELYHAALEKQSGEREAFLDEACAGDEELRREVESLLGYEQEAGRLMEQPAPTAATQRLAVVRGARLGPYEVGELIGSGGMGEVYRARDTRLGRDVAIKVLPELVAHEPEALRRFEQEVRAVAALTHPRICALHDIGRENGIDFAVMELLEGETLRARLGRGPLPVVKAVELAEQICQGLAAAHQKGIVHRDLKPENLFLTRDGLKILDFGLARRTGGLEGGEGTAPRTRSGLVLGTVGYLSPEQARGEPADARSDVFALGAVLYEMLSGRRAFQRETEAETLTAILKEDAPDLVVAGGPVPSGLGRIVRRSLEKDPEDRFHSAHDLGLALELASSPGSGLVAAAAKLRPTWQRWLVRGAFLLAGIGLVGSAVTVGRRLERRPATSFKRITYRRGSVLFARFTPDYQAVAYTARWEGKQAELFLQRLASLEARTLGVTSPFIDIAGTAGGEVAVRSGGWGVLNTLARLPLEGGPPRELLKDIDGADWDPSGTQFAIVRRVEGRQRLEYPVGTVLLETKGLENISTPRVSPDGSRVAFRLYPNSAASGMGDLCVAERTGRKQTLSARWQVPDTGGLAWSPEGREVWFSATRERWKMELHAVTLSGKERLVTRLPGSLILQDIAPDGRVLFTFGQALRWETRGRMAGDGAERDLSWQDGTYAPVLAPNGKEMLFQEWYEAAGAGGTYFQRMDGSPPKRLGNGCPVGVSPDWTTALVVVGPEQPELRLVPIGAGETRVLPLGSVNPLLWALWAPDGKHIVIIGSEADGAVRLFVQDIAGGTPRPFARLEEMSYLWFPFSLDSRFIAAKPRINAASVLYPLDGGEPRPIPYLKPEETPLVFGLDGHTLFLAENALHDPPLHVLRLDLRTGARQPWLELSPLDRAGVTGSEGQWLTPDGRFYAYSFNRQMSDLYLAEDLR